MSAVGVRERAPARALRDGVRTFATLTAHALRLRAKGALIWGVALGAFGVMMVAIFPAMGDAEQLEEYLSSFPEGLMKAIGVEDAAAITTVEGFLDAEIFALVAPLAVPFFAILAAAGAIAGAEERRILDVLLGNPLPRWQVVVCHFVAIAVSLAVVLAIFGAMMWGSAVLLDVDLPAGVAAEAVLGLLPLCLFFGGLAMLLSAVFHRRAAVVGLSGAILLGMYFLDALGAIVEELEGVRRLSVIYQYGSPITDGIDWAAFAGVCAAALVLVVLAAVAFRRRDIYT